MSPGAVVTAAILMTTVIAAIGSQNAIHATNDASDPRAQRATYNTAHWSGSA